MPIATHHYDASPTAPRRARAWITGVLRRWGIPRTTAAGLLTSELVSDAVRRSPSRIDVRVELAERAVHVEVGDGDGGLVPPADEEPAERAIERELRLRLVDRLASRWGSEGGRDRTDAWFEVTAV